MAAGQTPLRHDVVIVGGRAAGAATALLLARMGHDVLVVERDVFPLDTVSTHQIARSGVVQLQRWGLLPSVLASGAPAIRQVTFTAGGVSDTRTVKHKAGVDLLVAPRRHVLDTLVAEAASAAGARVRFGIAVTGLHVDAGRVRGVLAVDRAGRRMGIRARLVIGADGLASRVAAAVRAPIVEHRGSGGAVQYAYYGDVPWRGIELFAAERTLAGVFPTHGGEACVWVASPTAEARVLRLGAASRVAAFTGHLETAAPELAARLRTGRRTSPVTGMLRMPNQVRRAYGPGWALVGDAGYHRDAVTGYGLSDAYRDAELLAVAVDEALRGETDEPAALAAYASARDAALREVFDITCALAAYPPVPRFVDWQKRLSRAIDRDAHALAARPLPGERRSA